ncbi:MAG TPA: hypothetical protein VFU41_05430 [Gemmatimonadales bacterium]|nr:hypothetical protein [Gemmatimonadales bacterium]
MTGIRRGIVAAVLLILSGAAAWVVYRTNQQVVSGVTVVNPEGAGGKALVVYHPGLSDFQERVTGAFVAALVTRGWRVEQTTASSRAPTDLSGYDLLVVGGPTYWFTPAYSVRRYVARLGDLRGKPTAILITGAGAVSRSRSVMERQVRAAHGEIVVSLALTTMRPNDEAAMLAGEDNRVTAERMAGEAARRIPPSHP